MTDPDDTAGWKLANLRIPAWLALLFFGPIVAAIVMYYAGGDPWRPSGSVADGVLLTHGAHVDVRDLGGGGTDDLRPDVIANVAPLFRP